MRYEVETDGKVVGSATAQEPFDYIHGTRTILPKLEEALEGLEAEEDFDCTVAPEDAYGAYDLKKVFDIPKKTFVINGQLREDLLRVGAYIPLLNSAGEVCQGMVVSVGDETVTMDFNPPMAGKTLHFKGTVLSVREATPQELLEGLHGEFLPDDGCGCGCGHHHHHGHCCGHDDCGGDDGCCKDDGCCHGHGDGNGCCHS